MKKVFKVFFIIFLTLFSFYYTDKIISFFKLNDPIMKKINDYKNELEVSPVNGILTKDTMLVGSNGYAVDVDTSYEKMKKLEMFNSNLLEYLEISPKIKKENNLDKLIEGKNTSSKIISFIFMLDDLSRFDEIIYILDTNNVNATFFIDSKIVEDNLVKLNEFFAGESTLGLYSYNSKYDNTSFKYGLGVIKRNITSYSNYCLYINEEFFSTCIKNKYNTIKPILVEKNLYNYIKNSKKEGYIYNIKVNDLNIRELNTTIIYLKQKGYNLLNIEELLKE